jgi:hypothetical protein
MSINQCKGCRFWAQLSPGRGECHGAPPSFQAMKASGAPTRAWPVTVEMDWCGMCQPIKEEPGQ